MKELEKKFYEKKIVIIGAGASGLILKSFLSEHYPNFDIIILEKKNIKIDNLNNFFEKNPKYLHPNVFSVIFKYLLKKYLNDIYLKIYNLNLISSQFIFSKKFSRIDFFKKILFYNKHQNVKIISGINDIKFIIKNNYLKKVLFEKDNVKKKIESDFVFDCSSSNNFFYKINSDLNNLKSIKKIRNKILITFQIKFLDRESKLYIDKIINYSDVTLGYDNYDLTIIKQNNHYSFTFTSSIFALTKIKAKEELELFLKKNKIFKFQIERSIKWIHKNNTFYETKNTDLIKNLVPVGDSMLITDPSNGMGLTSILFQSIFITKNINKFKLKFYFKFSKEIFFLLSENSLKLIKRKYLLLSFLIDKKKYIPFYSILRSLIEIFKNKKFFRNILKQF